MGQKGDLLELIDRAPAHLQTFEANRWTWRHHERSRRAFEALANRRGGAHVSHAIMIGSGPIEEALDRHDQVWIELLKAELVTSPNIDEDKRTPILLRLRPRFSDTFCASRSMLGHS